MTELATRDFISQWTYDHGQDRDDEREEAAALCIGVDRVAELMRRRQERRLDGNIDAMGFDARAAALDAHFLRAPRCESPGSNRRSPAPVQPTRVRPQSASLARRAADTGTSQKERPVRQRPQSAKYRSDMARCDDNVDPVDWNAPAQEKTSKWRGMLARGPEFTQLTLRKLELETYELLYRTLDQRQQIDAKPPTRRRRRRENAENTCKPKGSSPAPACGSGLHVARSRKKRQQEHDRRMMLGNRRQNARGGEQEKSRGGGEDKQKTIQEKTRRRNKLLDKKKSQRQVREREPDERAAKQEKPPVESQLQRPSSAHQANRGPWIPSGSASSLAIRGISPETSRLPLTQEQRVAQVLEVFQSHAKAHFRLSKHVQKQLKKAQQCARSAVENESRKTEQAVKHFSESKNPIKRGRPSSASRSKRTFDELINPGENCRGNQENDQVDVGHGATLFGESLVPDESLPVISPATPRFVIPPLKLPPNLWEYQLSGGSLDEDTESYQQNAYATLEGTSTFAPPAVSLTLCQGTSAKPRFDSSARDGSATPSQALRKPKPTVEDIYLAEGDLEQADAATSTGDSESPPISREQVLRGLHESPAGTEDVATRTIQLEVESTHGHSNSNALLLLAMGSLNKDNAQTTPTTGKANSCSEKAATDITYRPPSNRISTQVCVPVNCDENGSSGLENNSSWSIASEVDSVGNQATAATDDCTSDTMPDPKIRGNVEAAKDNANDEREEGEDTLGEHQAGVNSLILPIAVGVKRADPINLTSHLLVDNDDSVDNVEFNKVWSDNHCDPIENTNTDVLPSPDHGPGSLDVPSSLHEDKSVLLTCSSDSKSIEKICESIQTTILETSSNLDQDTGDSHCDGECGEIQEDKGDPSALPSPPSREWSTTEITNVVVATQSAIMGTPPQKNDRMVHALEANDDRSTVEYSGRSPKKASRSPKRSTKKAKDPFSVKGASPKDHGRRGEEAEDPLQLHQQEVTRSFLKRISSRKLVEHQPSKDQDRGGVEVGVAESVTAQGGATMVNVDDQMESSKPIKNEGSDDSNPGHERPSDCESTVEKQPLTEFSARCPLTTPDAATMPCIERVDMTTGFSSSADGGSVSTVVDNSETLNNSYLTTSNPEDRSQTLPGNVRDNVPPEVKSSSDSADPNPVINPNSSQYIPDHHHRAARKIQAQYRCFVRCRIILDQLRFIVAKQRREVRRKSRIKTKKTKEVVVDTTASVAISEYENEAGASSDVDRVAGALAVIPVDLEISSAAPPVETLKEGMKFAARNDSTEYVFDMFDSSNPTSGEEVQDDVSGHVAETSGKVPVMHPSNAIDESATSSENLVDQQKLYGQSEKDVDAVNIANTAISCEPLQREEEGSDTQQPTGVGLMPAMLLAELAFSDDVEHKEQPNWERYVDSASNKSFYYNPATNETQWTNPVVNPIGTINTASNTTSDATDVKVVSECKTASGSGLWEEFLDDASGQLYYYNAQTGACSWEAPAAGSDAAEVVVSPQSGATAETPALGASPWIMYIDPASHAPYYVNVETLATTWEKPEDFAPESTAVVTTDAVSSVVEDAYVIAVDD